MKRIITAVVAAFVLAGCGGGGATQATAPPPAPVTVTVTSTPEVSTSTSLGDPFLDWAATHKVGELDLPALVKENPSGVTEFAKRYCPLLTGTIIGDVGTVVQVVKRNTNGSSEQWLALLEKAVEAYCPEKSRFLN